MSTITNYVSRADLGWGPSPAASANPQSGLVIHYDSNNMDLAGKSHSACITYWHNTRAFHTGPSRGWADIGYSFMACPHAYILEGRGLYKQQAAQPGGNATHYSVTLAGGPNDPIPQMQIEAVRELRAYLMASPRNNSGNVFGHRDFSATSCPGNRAYDLVSDGTFAQAPGAITTGDTMSFLGLRKGDSGQVVRDLQKYLDDAGYPPANSFFDGEWDGVYGNGVENAIVAARQANGSGATTTTHISYWAMNQLRRAHWKAMYERFRKSGGDGGTPSGGLELPATVRVSGELKLED